MKLDGDSERIPLCPVTNSGNWAWSGGTAVETGALLVFETHFRTGVLIEYNTIYY